MEIQPKRKGWNEGVISKDLRGVGGQVHRKGSIVRYRRFKCYDDSSGYRHTDYEYHVLDQSNYNLIRTPSLKIDGVELVDYWEISKNNWKNRKNENT